jgi:hypothetical protein
VHGEGCPVRTILSATGTLVPDDARLEGVHLLATPRFAETDTRALFWRIATPIRQQRAVRRGDWKLLIDGEDAPEELRVDEWRAFARTPRRIGLRKAPAYQNRRKPYEEPEFAR